MNAFRKNIVAIVNHEGITLQVLADRCEMRRSYLSRLVHGHHSPNLAAVEKIAKALRIKPHELIMPGFSKNLSNVT
jgi:transcriptional regulator with XRE-family HTH domain